MDGMGLAAPQIGWNVRIFIVNVDGKELVVINPIVESYGDMITFNEGCLSIPDMLGTVDRKERVRVTAENLNGERYDMDVGGMLARCILHENDHLDGVLFIDKARELHRGSW